MFKKESDKISPLKAKPLRAPGQSLDEEIQSLVYDKFLFYLIFAVFVALLAVFEWYQWAYDLPPNPFILSVIAAGAIGVTAYQFFKGRKQLHALSLGRDGEKAVGQYLENLRVNGYKVFHDVLGETFNVDHVVVSKKGICVIETKTISKRKSSKRDKVVFDGNEIRIGGMVPNPGPIEQVRAEADWIKNLLLESTGKAFPVRPVVLYPGWYVETNEDRRKKSGIWVLNPKNLDVFISNEEDRISQEDVNLASYHLSRYIRTH